MKNLYNTSFDTYVCAGDTIEAIIDKYKFVARIEYDGDYSIDDDDCHNTDPTVTGCNAEHYKELLAARESYSKGDWFYCGIIVSLYYNDILIDSHFNSLWGLEANYPNSKNEYLTEAANELLDLDLAAEKVNNLRRKINE